MVVIGAEKLQKRIWFRLQDAFEESDLPFRVDVLDWYRTSPNFRKIIERQYEIMQPRPAF